MSIRINLAFDIMWSRSLLAQGIRVRIIRLIGHVRFWTGSDWTSDEPAILATNKSEASEVLRLFNSDVDAQKSCDFCYAFKY